MRSPNGSLRVFPQVRSLLIDDLNAESPRPTLFMERYYEAANRQLPADWEQVTKLQALIHVWRAPPQTLELFEPLWVAHLPFWVALAATHRIRTAGADTRRVFFAIENNDLSSLVPRGSTFGGLPTKLTRLALRLLIPILVDKIAYGSQASQELYSEIVGSQCDTRLIPQVRSSRRTRAPAKSDGTVAFVGALHERKGLPLLLSAWEILEREMPHAQLTIIGDGPLAEDVERWAAANPDRRLFRGRLERPHVVQILTHTSVIAVPSQPWGRWREQINGAIQEALSVGCTVVTTTETGLATWLQEHGHTVVAPDASAEDLCERLSSAVRAPLDPAAVLESLPPRDGRVLADLWLHALGPGDDRGSTYA
jgi:glycosyltransferase involved in cell wall biosynthesis